ncbi:helix-hairpin-helix domain-containing protein [Cytobacillus gottheilii]|uniref:Helix-hairpin-helix domain-containing protein n=1 Tax=Cytobacillus gottheilii TaxID=859144 RepID=A0ABX8F8U3_9BACI|nr:helix-hairpin-helix domain-containing protein [Cytobacillus gottheilii]QVY60414.1 helix-hairpin-helix domain-containing protein [Cytobacillus gottheilii]
MLHFIKEKKLYFMLICLGAGMLILFLFFSGNEGDELTQINEEAVRQQEALPVTEEVIEEPVEEETIILVDVKGSVENPGVYEAEDGDRVVDLIAEAGGLENDADEKMINFAQRVTDEMVLYIPKEGEESAGIELNMSANSNDDETVNLNTADSAELQTLPGIGPAKAEAIIDYRDTNGSFAEKEELKEISGIGDKTYEKLAELIKVN